ncbi:MAG TPA: hypothetical protein VG455_09255 [Acidimicrobiales bacterium]|nr:hypothetical protein [Acidimicrobiales bacterium]
MGFLDRKRARAVALVAIAAMGLAACGDDDDESADTTTPTTAQAQGSASVTVDMVDYAYSVSGPLTQGGSLKVANRGKEFHLLAIGKLKPGKTLADLQTVLSESGPGGGGGPEETTTSTGATTPTTTGRGAATTTSSAPGGAGGGEGEGGGEEEDPTAEVIEEVGWPGHFMSPGESAEVSAANLTPGTYAFVCFIPTEGEGTPHFAKGMISQMEVVAGTAPPAPTADATYTVAPGQAVEGPATLSAGRQVLKIETSGDAGQLEPSLARLNPGATFQQLDQAFVELFETETPEPGSASKVPGQVIFGGRDLEGVTTTYLTVDLEAGNYVLVAEDTDEEDGPSPPREIINIRVT